LCFQWKAAFIGALRLAYYDPDDRLVYAGRAGTGINTAELESCAVSRGIRNPGALRSIATTSSERLTDPVILPWRRSFSACRD
jgi:hypothetical protein